VNTPDRKQLWRSVLRLTGRDPGRVGCWLSRHRRSERLRWADLARRLGVTMGRFVLLALCRTPRDDQFRDDLETICARTGAEAGALARLLRQEQALARWSAGGPAAGGWLMAASDAAPLEKPEGKEGPPREP
jgi:hypothetical protein